VTLEAIIVLIILIPVVVVVVVHRKRDGAAGFAALCRRITGNFLLVLGILLLFPAFYRFFHGRGDTGDLVFPAISLLLVFGGRLLAGEGKPQRHNSSREG